MDSKSHGRARPALALMPLLWVALALALIGLKAGGLSGANAQGEELWAPPTNLSASGSASQPAIALAPAGVAHVLWWDRLDGSRYARGLITGTQMIWSRPQPVPFLFGNREVNPTTGRVALSPPLRLQTIADGTGAAHATWFDARQGLRYAYLPPSGQWGEGPRLADAALVSTLALDISGTLRLAYIQSAQTPNSPAGVYYAQRVGGAIRRTLVYSSTYFRTADPDDVSVGVAADGVGNVVVVWRQSREDQAQYARSTDNGVKWSTPQPIVDVSELFGLAAQANVAVTPDREFVLIWRDSSAPGCGMTQRRSADGGQTWSQPERVLTELRRCPTHWSFSIGGDGKLWFIGTPASDSPLSDTNGVLAAWDGAQWSKPAEVQLSYEDATTQRRRVLGCLDLALSAAHLVASGCDVRGDVWSAHNAIAPARVLPSEVVVWNAPIALSTGRAAEENAAAALAYATTQHVAVAADPSGQIYALWSRATRPGLPASHIDLAIYRDGRFTTPATIMRVGDNANNRLDPDSIPTRMDAPSLAVNAEANTSRLHLVWSGGSAGRPFYSRAFARDANSLSGWSQPRPLPANTSVGASPHIIADPRGQLLYVIYAIPFNEQRGVYVVRSEDDGENWSSPSLVADGVGRNWEAVDQPQLALDPTNDVLHATWLQSVLPGATGSRAVYYARSADRGRTWTEPTMVAQGDVELPRIAVFESNAVMLAWNVMRTTAGMQQGSDVWYQVSNDGGARWTRAAPVPSFDNLTGGSALVGDGAGQLYLTALSAGSGGQARLLYAQWQGRTWSAMEEFSLGQPAVAGNTAAGALVTRDGTLQLLMRIYELKPNGNGVWESVAISRGVKPTELIPLPTFTPLPIVTPTPIVVVLPTEIPEPPQVSTTLPLGTPQASPINVNMLLISASIVAVVVVTGAVIGLMFMRRR